MTTFKSASFGNRMKTLFCVFCICAGCLSREVDFTLLSTKNVDLSRADDYYRGERVQGRDTARIILFVPVSTTDLKEAIDNTIESVPGCVALADGVIYKGGWYIPFFYGERYIVVEGTPIIDRTLRPK